MQLFGLTIARTKRLQGSLSGLLGITGSTAWWPLIRESFTGAWQQNVEISVQTVTANPTLFACLTLIAGDIGKLRPMLVEQDTDRIWAEIDSPAFSPVLAQPNDYQLSVDFLEWWMMSKLCHGNTYVLKGRDGRGVVQSLYVLDPFRVMPLLAPDGSVFYQLAGDPLAEVPMEGVTVPAREIIHDAAGVPALQGLNMRRASEKFFTNGSKPGGVLTAPGQIAQATADRLKAYWDTNFSGDNTGKIAVLGDGLKYEPMAMTAEQSKLVEQLKMTDEDIAKCFHMPRHKVGIGPDPTYNNISALNQQYYTDCLQSHIVKLQAKLTQGLGLPLVSGRTLAVELDLDDLQLMDPMTRIEAGVKAITGGMAPNEVRKRFYDVGPVKNGDQPFLQKQNWPLDLLGSDQPMAAAPAPPAQTVPALPAPKAIDLTALPGLISQKLLALREAA